MMFIYNFLKKINLLSLIRNKTLCYKVITRLRTAIFVPTCYPDSSLCYSWPMSRIHSIDLHVACAE